MQNTSKTAGFTLVELLVVIGIIATLIAVLLPALSAAQGAAKHVACLSQMRQLGSAFLLQAQDHQGYLQVQGYLYPPAGASPAELNDNSKIRYAYFSDGVLSRPLNMSGALAPYVGQRIRLDSYANVAADVATGIVRKIFTCPADRNPLYSISVKAVGYTGPYMWSSYAYNHAFFGWKDTPFRLCRGQLTKLREPTKTMLLADALPNQGVGGYCAFSALIKPATLAMAYYMNNASDVSMFDPIRHKGKINILFGDMHAENAVIPKAGSSATVNGPLTDVYLVAP